MKKCFSPPLLVYGAELVGVHSGQRGREGVLSPDTPFFVSLHSVPFFTRKFETLGNT